MKPLLTFLFLSVTSSLFSQTPIDVTEQTIKIGGMREELLYFGFAEGDQIVFNFTEVDGKELKEVDISEYPSTSKYADFKTARIDNKTITVNRKGIYQFRFSNGAVSGRICKIKIQRIPADDQAKGFNTNVNWVKKQDTTWNTYTKDVIVGYDTSYRQVTKKELVKTELREEMLFDKSQRVHSQSNENGNKTWLFFSLPKNQLFGYQTTKVVSWAYWIGVGEEANTAWKNNVDIFSSLVEGVVTACGSPLGGFAAGKLTSLVLPQTGEDVSYAITDEQNKDYFMAGMAYSMYDKGKGIASYKAFTDPGLCRGTYFIALSNDNYTMGINVTVKVSAIVETNIYEDKTYTEQVVTPRYEKKIFSDPVISTRLMPVTGS